MNVTIGKDGLIKTWQAKFPETTSCVHCGGESRIGFVAHEGLDGAGDGQGTDHVCGLHVNGGSGDYWLHDCCAVAVYFCKECLETTALYNQA